MTTHSVSIDDEGLNEFLDEYDGAKSEALREGLRLLQREELSRRYPDLSDDQAMAYNWLVDYAGISGRLLMKTAETHLAQIVSYKKELVVQAVMKPLGRKGYIRVNQGYDWVTVVVMPPPENGESESVSASSASEGEESGDDELSVEEEWERQESATVLGGESDD